MSEEIVTTSFVKRMVEEIEDLKKINQQHRKINGELREIIKEAREYLEPIELISIKGTMKKDILEILDKENK